MAFAFGINEDPKVAVRRVATELIDSCAMQLGLLNKPDSNIHELRRSCKKFRALLRLLHRRIDKQTFTRENAVFRDLACLLAACRESLVRIDTFDSLQAPDATIRGRLCANHQHHLKCFLADVHLQENMLDQLTDAAMRIRLWPLDLHHFQQLRDGCLRVHDRARKQMLQAYSAPNSLRLHKWRKQVKYLWYQARLLTPCKAWLLTTTNNELSGLGDALGREHDLAELACWIDDNRKKTPDYQSLFDLIQTRQQQLRTEIFTLAIPVFPDSNP